MVESNKIISKMLDDIRVKLLDLTKRNRLLNFRRNKSSITIVDEQPRQVFQRMINDGKSMIFAPLPEPDPEDDELEPFEEKSRSKEQLIVKAGQDAGIDVREELPLPADHEDDVLQKHTDNYLQTKLFMPELETRLRRIQSNANSIIEETGQNQLYLAMGFLQWKERNDTEAKYEAPLVLIPVEVERGKVDADTRCYNYKVSYTGEDLIPNLSLAKKLKNDFNLILPNFEDKQAISGVNGDGELDPEAYFKTVLDTVSKMKGWTVLRKMVLGFFTFSKFLMYLDLDSSRWPNSSISEHPLIGDLLVGHDPTSSTLGNKYEFEEERLLDSLRLVIDADSSQTEAIVKALNGQNMVIQGPPGTGKSQTITNLIAGFLEEGKTILFVAEKMAALNVVYRNLDKVGLSDFCLELHSHKLKKKTVLENLEKRAKRKYKDTAQLSSEIDHLKVIRQVLCEYVDLIKSCVGPNKETVFDVFWKSESYRNESGNHVPLTIDNVERIVQKDILARTSILELLQRFIEDIGIPKDNVWYGYKPTQLYYEDNEVVSKKLSGAGQVVAELVDKVSKLLLHLNSEFDASKLTSNNIIALIELGSMSIEKELIVELVSPFLISNEEKPWDTFNTLNDAIQFYNENLTKASRLISTHDTMSIEKLEKIANFLSLIKKKQLSSITLKAANDIAHTCSNIISLLESISVITKKHAEDGLSSPKTIVEFESFLEVDSIVRGKPPETESLIAKELYSKHFIDAVKRAIETGRQLTEDQSTLSEAFDISIVPPSNDLVAIRKVLRQYKTAKLAWLHSDFRKTKKELLGFLKDRSMLKNGKAIDELEKLEGFLQKKEAFFQNSDYCQLLGGLFQGIDTDFDCLESIMAWSELLYNSVKSITLAKQLANLSKESISKWSSRESLEDHLCLIKNELDMLDRLFKGSPHEKQSDISKTHIQPLILNLTNLKNILEKTYENILPIILKQDSTLSDINQSLLCLIASIKTQAKIDRDEGSKALLGSYFKGVDTNIAKINKTLKWFSAVKKLGLSNEFMNVFSKKDITEVVKVVSDHSKEWHEDLNDLNSQIESIAEFGVLDQKQFWGKEFDFMTMDGIAGKIKLLLNKINHLVKWADYSRSVEKAEKLGLESIVSLVETGELNAELVVNTYLHAIYNTLARKILKDNSILSTFTKTEYEEHRKKFCELDKKIQRLSQQRIAYGASKNKPPSGVGRGPIRGWSEMSLLDREFNKSRAHIPIRRLLERSGEAIRTLKPVFMMSPMSVAQFLAPGQHQFDVVIMDEASQIQPHEALGAIARGKQMIIVGDSKQLPPTTFFDTTLNNLDDEERDENIIDDTESILDITQSAHFPSHRLRWHYRSEHESLIAFSNAQWYDNDLVIFPSPCSSEIKLGVYYTFIKDATYAKGKNEIEADYTAKRIIDHAKKYPHISLGVGTFNARQKELIEDRLAKYIKEDSTTDSAINRLMGAYDGSEPLFIKNLENLQGDERDVIYISCTYGPDKETGRVFQRFGPINGKNGPRRLNVLFTRAKKRLEIFSSMQPEDIIGGYGASEGTNALKKFFKYAQTGELADFGIATSHEPDSDFEIAVAKVLDNHGFATVPQVGVSGYFIDIGVQHPHRPGEYILGVECDGATYHSSKFARERDRLREEVLIRRGWNIHRIWSTDWFKNRGPCIEMLLDKLNSLVEADGHVVREAQEPIEEEVTPDFVEIKERMPDEELTSRLVAFREANIGWRETILDDCILRDKMLRVFVMRRPITRNDFMDYFSCALRADTEPDDLQYIDDIFDIIEKAEGL